METEEPSTARATLIHPAQRDDHLQQDNQSTNGTPRWLAVYTTLIHLAGAMVVLCLAGFVVYGLIFCARHRPAQLAGVNWSGRNIAGRALDGANLRGANLAGANLAHASLAGADLRDANLSGAILTEANLSRANLSRADISRADFSNADLSSARLIGVVSTAVKFDGATMAGTRYSPRSATSR